MDALSDGWIDRFDGIFYVDDAFFNWCSEEPSDLLRDRVKVNVVETGSGWQAGHGAHLRETKDEGTLRTIVFNGAIQVKNEKQPIFVFPI